MAHRPACVKCTWVEKVYKQWGTCTDSRPWGASFLCDSSSCHPTGAPSSFICSQLTATLGFEAMGCLVCVSRLFFFWRVIPQGKFWLSQSGLEPKDIICWTLWCGDSPSAWLWEHPKFTQVTLRLFAQSWENTSPGMFSWKLSTVWVFMVNWSCTGGYLGSEQWIFAQAESEIAGGLSLCMGRCDPLIHQGRTKNQICLLPTVGAGWEQFAGFSPGAVPTFTQDPKSLWCGFFYCRE